VKRPTRIAVRAVLPVTGETIELVTDAFEARALQHEIDHCAGLLFLDRVAGAHALHARKVYLDPGTAGPNELHATFFDSAGTALAIQSVTFALTSATGPLTVTPRIFEPGHFVADTTLAAGTYTFSVSAPAPGGDILSTRLDLPVTK
jgi:hypothetical protein